MAVVKSAQCGLSVCGINRALWFADMHQSTIVYTFPTQNDVQKFTASRINPIIALNKYAMSRVAKLDSVELKQFNKSFIHFKGVRHDREAQSIDADLLIHDERDRGEPDVYDQYRSRLDASSYGYELDFSTPTIPGYGITMLYDLSDQHEWFIKCSGCNLWQILDFDNNIINAQYVCAHCGKLITNEDRLAGRWIPRYPGRSIRGYRISQLMSTHFTASDIILKKQTRRPKNFYNLVLGMPYTSAGSGLTSKLFYEKAFIDRFSHFDTGRGLYMGVDQGEDLYVVVGYPEGGNLRVVHVEITPEFSRVGQLMSQYGIYKCVIDGGPNQHSARQLSKDFPERVKLCYYKDIEDGYRETEEHLIVDRTESLDSVVDRVYSGTLLIYNEDAKADAIIEKFISQCCNSRRDEEEDEDSGERRYVWKKVGPDHFLHALNYLNIAASGGSTPLVLPNASRVVSGRRDFSSSFTGRGDRAGIFGKSTLKVPKDMYSTEVRGNVFPRKMPRPGIEW